MPSPVQLVEPMSEEEILEDWLPVTASRRGKWYSPAVYKVAAMVAAGVLELPHAMAQLGWGPGVAMLVLSWVLTLYTFWQMIQMHEMVPGKRFDRYHELGQAAFGKKLGLYIVVPQQLLFMVSVCIIFNVTSGKLLENTCKIASKNDESCSIDIKFWILIFSTVHFVTSFFKSFHSIFSVALAAAAMSVGYSTIAWGAATTQEVPAADYSYNATTPAGTIFRFFNAMGGMAFAFSGHNINLEIQATIPSTPERPSKGPMWTGTIVAYLTIAFCYFPVALAGYRRFGNQVKDNILESLKRPPWLIALANMLAVVHFIGTYQLFAMAVFDLAESVLVRKYHFKPTNILRFTVRYSFVGFTAVVAFALPHFSALTGVFGGLIFAPTSYFLPCVIWLILKRPEKYSLSWWTNWVCIVLGVLLMLIGTIGGIRKLIHDVQNDQFRP